jgi:hypothetical protein
MYFNAVFAQIKSFVFTIQKLETHAQTKVIVGKGAVYILQTKDFVLTIQKPGTNAQTKVMVGKGAVYIFRRGRFGYMEEII